MTSDPMSHYQEFENNVSKDNSSQHVGDSHSYYDRKYLVHQSSARLN